MLLFSYLITCCSIAWLIVSPTLCDAMDCSLPGSSVRGIFPGKNTEVGCHFCRYPLLFLSANLHYLHLCLFNSRPACLAITGLWKGKQGSWPQSVYSMLATTELWVAIEAGVILLNYICWELIAEDTYWEVSVSTDSHVLMILKAVTIGQAVIQLRAKVGPFSWSWRLGIKQFALEI